MTLAILIAALITIFYLNYRYVTRDLLSPSNLFTVSFLALSVFAVGYCIFLNYVPSVKVGLVIFFGVLIFNITAYITSKIFYRIFNRDRSGNTSLLVHKDSGVLLGFNFVLFAALIIIEIVTFVWTLISLADMYPKDSVAESIAAFRYAATFTDEVKKFPVILSGLRRVCEASGYLVAIVIAELIFKKDYRKLYLPITAFLFLIPLNLEVGSRTALFQEYFAFIVIFFLVRKFYTGQIVDLNRKTVGIAAILFIAFICVFQLMAVGRDYTQNPFYYIGTYIGAEIPNLDMFLNDSSNIAGNVGNSVTFIRSINLLGSVLGIDSLQYSLDLPFLTYGGVVTGNVYTTFRPFIYDFGYLGFVVLTMLMSCVSQLIYSLATNNIKSYRFIDIYMILYGVLSCQLLLSFFSNKFYERFFSLQFLLTIIILLVVRFIYKKLSLLLKNKFPNFCS